MEYKQNRRNFVKISASGVAGLLLLSRCTTSGKAQWLFFTESEVKAVEAVCEQIIPTDHDPGAREAHVIHFIDKQLVSNYSRFQTNYRNGIRGLQETSTLMFGDVFEKLKWEDQTSVLLSLESGKAGGKTWEQESSSHFFNLIRDHSMQGFYGHPRHGGNSHYMSFKMLRVDYPHIIGQNRYEHPKM
jgi:gluconate 2-dehydrogenase gamma chain